MDIDFQHGINIIIIYLNYKAIRQLNGDLDETYFAIVVTVMQDFDLATTSVQTNPLTYITSLGYEYKTEEQFIVMQGSRISTCKRITIKALS